jgi:hypothetical protein
MFENLTIQQLRDSIKKKKLAPVEKSNYGCPSIAYVDRYGKLIEFVASGGRLLFIPSKLCEVVIGEKRFTVGNSVYDTDFEILYINLYQKSTQM